MSAQQSNAETSKSRLSEVMRVMQPLILAAFVAGVTAEIHMEYGLTYIVCIPVAIFVLLCGTLLV